MRVLVTGGNGLLGSAVSRALASRGHDVTAGVREAGASVECAATTREMDVTDGAQVRRVVVAAAPEVVFHCAAYTDVDGAEARPHEAMSVNADGTRSVALAALRAGATVVYPSTDYVFDGTEAAPYRPGDPRRPVNAYGRSKKGGEDALRGVGGRWLIFRTSWLYGSGRPDFVDAVLERARAGEPLRVVDDQRGRPTWTGSLAPAMVDLVERALETPGWLPLPPAGRGAPAGLTGRILHLADRGTASWYELAVTALRIVGLEAEVEAVSSEDWGAPARRPANSVLDVSAAEERLGRPMPEWTDSLERHLAPEREAA